MNSLYHKQTRISDIVLKVLIYVCTLFSCGLILIIIGYVFSKAIPHFHFSYLTHVHSARGGTDGILGNIVNTLYIILTTLLIACPLGIGSGIYLNEYAKNKKLVNMISFTTEVLAGIPSIIFGLFGMIVFGQYLGLSYSILTGSLTLAILILPIITRNTQIALQAVPKSYREAALGMGATKWYMVRTVLLPSAIPGILTGVILAMGRIIAESAALLFTAGSGYFLPKGLFEHFFASGGTLTIQLYLEMSKAHYDNAFVIAMILIIIILLMNYLAKYISKKFDVNKVK